MGLMLSFCYQISGINAIIPFMHDFYSVGINDPHSSLPQTFSICFALLNNVFTILSVYLNHRFGRKGILLVGTVMLTMQWGAYALIGYLDGPSNIVAKVLVMCFPVSFAWSSGGVTFLYLSETLPEIGMSVTTVFSSGLAFAASQFFLELQNTIDYMGIALIFGIGNLLCFIFFSKYMIESKDKTRAEILLEYKTGVTGGRRVTSDSLNPILKSESDM